MKRKLGLALAGMSFAVFASLAAAQTLDTLPFSKKLALAKAGDEEAQIAVAMAYEKGEGAKESKLEASKWYGKAADRGNADAQYRLATLFHEGATGLKKNPERAFKLYQSAAKQGHTEAQNWLGYCYQHGLGVKQDDKAAVEWYQKAADGKLAIAENNLGLMYLGAKGVDQDYRKAFDLFERSANQGYDWGMNNLGGLYEKGWGTEQDLAKALFLYKQAAAKGNEAAAKSEKRLEPQVIQAGGAPAAVEPASAKPDQPGVTTTPVPNEAKPASSDSSPPPLSAANPLDAKPQEQPAAEVAPAPAPAPEKKIKSDSSGG